MRRCLVALLCACCALAAGATAASADTVVKVTANDVGSGWAMPTAGGGSGSFAPGPGIAPLGAGSLHMVTAASGDKVGLSTDRWAGTPLADVDALGYATYRDPLSTAYFAQVPSINVTADVNGAAEGGFTTLVFEPVYNTDQGAVTAGAWQTWDAYRGGTARWWSTRDIPGVCAFNCFVDWATIVADNPDAVLGTLGVNQGSGNQGLTAATDALRIGTGSDATVYDFEPLTGPPATKDACKQGGWQTFDNPAFRNQGDCVSYVATGGRH